MVKPQVRLPKLPRERMAVAPSVGSSRMVRHRLVDVPAGFTVDGLAQAVQLPRQPHGHPSPLAASGGQHYESGAGLSAHWQLWVVI